MIIHGADVLIVDDDFFVAESLHLALEDRAGAIVHSAASVRIGLTVMGEHSDIVLAVLDYQLSGETSVEVADALVAAGIPFVFYTGAVDEVPTAKYGVPVVSKPLIEDLLAAIAQLTERRSGQ